MYVQHPRYALLSVCALVVLVVLAGCGAAPAAQAPRTAPLATPPPASEATEAASIEPTATPRPAPSPTPTFAPMVVADADVQAGRTLYGEVCAPCHGFRATGIEGIGIDLTKSKLVAGLTPEQLGRLLIRGVGINNPFNLTEIRMPPRGGRDDLDNQAMLNIAVYLQQINTQEKDPTDERITTYLDWVESGGEEGIEATPEVGKEGLTGQALEGQTPYLRFCAVCHGPNGEGVEGLGKGFRGSEFIAELNDKELGQFLVRGRAADHELNETGIEMLPYGGQPYLDDETIAQLVAYVRAVSTGELVPQAEAAQVEETVPNPFAGSEGYAVIESVSPRCFACHLIGTEGNVGGPGPHLNGLKDRAGSRVPDLSAEEYVRQSILDPGIFIVDQCPRGPCVDVMVKNYSEKLTDEQLDTLVEFLLSLPEDADLGIDE